MQFTDMLVAVAAATAVAGAHAQPPASTGARPAAHQPAAGASQVDAEVRRIDKAQGKITLRHGPIPSLDMPNMTMVFRVTDPRMLDDVQEGDKVKFTADRINGVFTVTSMHAVR